MVYKQPGTLTTPSDFSSVLTTLTTLISAHQTFTRITLKKKVANNERQNAAIAEHLQAPYIHTGRPRLKLLELPKAQVPRTEIKEMLLLSTELLNSIILGH